MNANNKIIGRDVFQAAVGSFSASLLFFVLKEGPLNLEWKMGLLITLVWAGIIYWGFDGQRKSTGIKKHFALCFIVSIIVSAALSILFGLVTTEQLFSKEIFGSTVMIGLWLGLPVSLLFDLKNLDNVLSSYNQYWGRNKR